MSATDGVSQGVFMSPPISPALAANLAWRVNRYGHWEAQVGQLLLQAELHYQHFEPYVRAAANGTILATRTAPLGLEDAKAEAAKMALELLEADQEKVRSLMGWVKPASRGQILQLK
jgi:hypothetical protein